ncbi:MAG: VIT domain-containing protein, partial [Acidobacteriota bacterium]
MTDRIQFRLGRRLALTAAAVLGLSLAATGQEGSRPAGETISLEEARQGMLLFKTTRANAYLASPALDTDVVIRVSGIVARTEVAQRFRNGTGGCVEGIYVFPLPEGAAVDRLRMTIAGRIIEGEIRERQEAKKAYELAKSEGRKASLLEQERPNIFTVSVASIGSDEEILVTIEYQEAVRYDSGKFHLRFPMVVAPRYMPGGDGARRARIPAEGRPSIAADPPASQSAGTRNPV